MIPSAAVEGMPTPKPSLYGAIRGMWTLTWRSKLTWRRILQVLSSMLSLPIFATIIFEPGQTEGFTRLLIQVYMFLVLPVLCVSHFGSMIRDELQDDTMTFLITRPVSRARLYVTKYVTLMLWVQIILLGNALAFWIAGMILRIDGIHSLIVQMIQVQFLGILAFGALSSLMGLATQKYLIAAVVYGLIVEVGIGQIPTNINVLSISRHLKTLLAHNPELSRLYGWTTDGTSFSLGMIAAGTALFIGLGAALFHFREYHHTDEVRKSS